MKKLLFATLIAAAAAGCCTSPCCDGTCPKTDAPKKDQYDIRPEETDDKAPTAAEWQAKEGAAIAKAVAPEAVAPSLESAAAADALLAQVKGAYKTDPFVATKIGVATQMAMCPTCKKAPAARKVWAPALLRAAQASADAYRTMFFLDQLRWCGYPEQAGAVANLGEKAKDRCVKEMAAIVARELRGDVVGK